MKTIGLIGGMSWESTVTYYQIINRTIQAQLGGLHSAKCIVYSVDFQAIETCQSCGDWQASAVMLSEAAQSLQRAGADCIVLCTNTMHKVAADIQAAVSIPFLHIADMTGNKLKESGIHITGLLGTSYTMEQDFYKQKLIDQGITVLVPEPADRQLIHSVIYEQLCQGIIDPEARQQYLSVIDRLAAQGAQGIILGCTEIGLLIRPSDCAIPLFDTAAIHAQAAADFALNDA